MTDYYYTTHATSRQKEYQVGQGLDLLSWILKEEKERGQTQTLRVKWHVRVISISS
jgi:hypothetical protein